MTENTGSPNISFMTPEELAALEKRLGETCLTEIQKQIEYKIVSEFAAKWHSANARYIAARARKMVDDELERRKDELSTMVHKSVDKLIMSVSDVVKSKSEELVERVAAEVGYQTSTLTAQMVANSTRIVLATLVAELQKQKANSPA